MPIPPCNHGAGIIMQPQRCLSWERDFFDSIFFFFQGSKNGMVITFPCCFLTSVPLNELSISKVGHSITKLLDTMSAACQWSKGERLVLE